MVLKLIGVSYEERRETLNLPTLEKRMRGNMITTNKSLRGHDDAKIEQFFEVRRGHNWKLGKRNV